MKEASVDFKKVGGIARVFLLIERYIEYSANKQLIYLTGLLGRKRVLGFFWSVLGIEPRDILPLNYMPNPFNFLKKYFLVVNGSFKIVFIYMQC